jgi:uncharacterized protein (DUF1778 family)
MHTPAPTLDERINLRASRSEKSLLKSASELAGFRDLTTFIMTTMRRESLKLIGERAQLPALDTAEEIEKFLRSFKVDASDYRFDRDDANAR